MEDHLKAYIEELEKQDEEFLRSGVIENQEIGTSKKAAVPSVGIWWIYDGKIHSKRTKYTNGEERMISRDFSFFGPPEGQSHNSLWHVLTDNYKELEGQAKNYIPRGRITYEKRGNTLIVVIMTGLKMLPILETNKYQIRDKLLMYHGAKHLKFEIREDNYYMTSNKIFDDVIESFK